MPATRPLDYTVSGVTYRECSECHVQLELTPENFQHRADNGWTDRRCQDCRRRIDAENRRLRRAGIGRRASRRGTSRRFGVEIEFIGAGYAEVVREMTARGLRCRFEGYTHRVMNAWKIVTDGSVSGYELVSPPLSGAAGFEQVEKACEALNAAGARVDRSCGLHVHHEATDLSGAELKRLVRGWSASQTAIDGLVAPSRRRSRWAGPYSPGELGRLDSLTDGADRDGISRFISGNYFERYRALNLNGFPRYGTVEVRQHQGSTNAAKIVGWIKFGQALVNRAKDADAPTSFARTADLVSALGSYGLDRETVSFMTRRAERFAAPAASVR